MFISNISFQELTDEEKYQIKEFFDMFDKNQDGLISAEELKEVLEAFDGTFASDEDIFKFVSDFSTRHDCLFFIFIFFNF